MGERITKVEKFVRWCENHKLISILVIVGLVIIALGNFTNALETICGLFKSSSQPISISKTNTPSDVEVKWQPPELPKDCKTVFFSIGSHDFKIPVANLHTVADWDQFMAKSGTNRINAFALILKDNRVYPMGHERFGPSDTNIYEGTVNDPTPLFDKLQSDYDFNFSENALEIVNQDKSPVFQVIYDRPNAIRMNGIFSMQEDAEKIFHEGEKVDVLIVFGKNETMYVSTNNADMRSFMLQFTNQTIFNYPSFSHRGEYRH